VDSIRTRVFGSKIYVDIKVLADGEITLIEGEKIAKSVHDAIESKFEKIKHITVYLKPEEKSEAKDEK